MYFVNWCSWPTQNYLHAAQFGCNLRIQSSIAALGTLFDRGPWWTFQLAEHENQQVRIVALDALDRAICGVLASQQFQDGLSRAGSGILPAGREVNGSANHAQMYKGYLEASELPLEPQNNEYIALECALIQPLSTLYTYGRITDVRSGSLKILLHVLEVSLKSPVTTHQLL